MMPPIHSRHARSFLSATAAAMLAVLIGSAAGATDRQGQQTVSNRQRLEQAWTPEGQPISTTAVTDGAYTVRSKGSTISDSTLTLDANKQSAEIGGNISSNTLAASTIHAGGDAEHASSPFAVLDNHQFGDNAVTAASRMNASVPGMIGGSTVTISDNGNAAFARMNDASNTLSVSAVDLGGDAVLRNVQDSNGKVMANTASNVSAGSAGNLAQTARVDLYGNNSASRADGNRALNSLSTSSASGFGGHAVLDNKQYNAAAVVAVTDGVFRVSGSDITQSAISVKGNSVSAMAVGNVALNAASVDGISQPVVLVRNTQINRGPVSVTAVASGRFGIGTTSAMNASTISLSGNTLAATAIGNQAVNTLSALGGVGGGSGSAPR